MEGAAMLATLPVAGVIGYLWALVGGGILIPLAMRGTADNEEGERAGRLNVGALGLVERTVYATAVLEGRPLFIIGWLVLKGAVTWPRRPRLPANGNRYLIEAGLSLAFGVSGGAVSLHLGEAGNEWVVLGYVLLPLMLCALVAGLSASHAPMRLLRLIDPAEARRRSELRQVELALASVAIGDLDAQSDGVGDSRDRGESVSV